MKIIIGHICVEIIGRATLDGIKGFKLRLDSGEIVFISAETLANSR